MSSRTNDLTETAKPIADKLYAQLGSLKRVLSAGILALNDHTPAMRQHYMALAAGCESELTDDDLMKEIHQQRLLLEAKAAKPLKTPRAKLKDHEGGRRRA